jgi:hypothetical protein
MKKEDALFGIDMALEIELGDGLCPPGLMVEGKRELANALVDIVVLSGGGYHGSNEQDEVGNKWLCWRQQCKSWYINGKLSLRI